MKTFKSIVFRVFTLILCLGTGMSAYADGTININTGTGSGSGFTFANGVLTITDSGYYGIIGNGTQTGNCIVVNGNVTATVTLDNVNISCASQSDKSAFDITDATVTLLLKNSNTLQSGENMAGIDASYISTLIIDSKENPGYETGELVVNGGINGAGIGGGYGALGGTITINGGIVTANGGIEGAGIGGGREGRGGSTTINGGIVVATSSDIQRNFSAPNH
jgi:hypothetical protein